MDKKTLTPLQAQYLSDCSMLQAIGYPSNLFDGLYLAPVEHIKEKAK